MREAFEQEAEKTSKDRLMITMAVPASLEYAGKGFDIASLDKNLDFFNLLTYDYHSSYEPATNHHSPLFRPADVSEFDFRADLNIVRTVMRSYTKIVLVCSFHSFLFIPKSFRKGITAKIKFNHARYINVPLA